MKLKGKRFLVIGGAGFIGSTTVDQLLKHDVAELRIYDNFSRGTEENLSTALSDPRVRIFELGGELLQRDILREAMREVDGVFHFAALWLKHCHDYPRSAFEVNVGGTFNVLEAMLEKGVQRLVYSSSASVYGDALAEPMQEDHPYNNTNFYGATKIAGEMMCRSLYHRYKGTPSEFSYVGLRYMNVFGPRQDYRGAYVSVIMKMLDKLDAGEAPVVYGDGSQAYDFVYVGDCAQANVNAMRAEVTDAFFNVGTGVKTSIKELGQILIDLTGASCELTYEPAGPTFVRNRVGSTAAAQRDLNFSATQNLRDGIMHLIEWRKSHKQAVEARRRVIKSVS